ncbi:MAG: toprim domain-containing protein [Paracoccaceae bacterium]
MCKDGIQWILQRQKKGAGARWAALSYCTTRDSLRRVWTTRTGGSAAEIDLLPDNVRGSDDAGRKAAKVLARRASTLGWDVSLLKAPEGQDWNDVLMGGAA